MIKDKVNELLPQLVEGYMRQFTVNMETSINGNASSDLKEDIVRWIEKQLR